MIAAKQAALRRSSGPSREHVEALRHQAVGEFLQALAAHQLGCPRAARLGLRQAAETLGLARQHADTFARLDDLREQLIEQEGGAPWA